MKDQRTTGTTRWVRLSGRSRVDSVRWRTWRNRRERTAGDSLVLLCRTKESWGSREVELSRVGDRFGRLLLGDILRVRVGQINVRGVHDATDDVVRLRSLEIVAKSVLANVPSVVARKNTVLKIDRVELSGGQIFSVDDLAG